ncbi:MAG: T9SS type A sorting domain-containing protein [Bacteroidales bacterium]|nr:T9SS type A sorting domain-containing protein [Bacteroidales bacterium]
MKKIFTLLFGMFITTGMLRAQTPVPAGDVYGNWTATGSPYLVEGDIMVPADCTLIIDAGVVVEFQGTYIFNIHGLIDCQGNETDSIIFTAIGYGGHRGLKIYTDTNITDSMLFTYCRFEKGRGSGDWPTNCGTGLAIQDFDRVRIEHCTFSDNVAYNGSQAAGGAIALGGFDGIIRNNSFINNRSIYGGGIMVWNDSDPLISQNYFYANRATYEGGAIQIWTMCDGPVINNTFIENRANQRGGAISIYDNSHPLVSHNLFDDNIAMQMGGAIFLEVDCNPVFLNNTFVKNHAVLSGGAIHNQEECCPRLINNIFWDNTSETGSQFCNNDTICIPDFFNNDIQYGQDSIAGFHSLCEWKSNIDAYPEFEDTTAANFFLTMVSPCIDAGVDTILDPDGTRSDMGAYYFDQTGIGIAEALDPADRPELYCWPNPAREEVEIISWLPGAGSLDARLSVFDMTGNKVDELPVNGEAVKYNATHLPPGMYLLRLQAGNRIATGKLVKR